jgi:CheY-like chemotaxis protein
MTPKRWRVLLVDDDTATRIGLTELLTDAGYDTRAVATFE